MLMAMDWNIRSLVRRLLRFSSSSSSNEVVEFRVSEFCCLLCFSNDLHHLLFNLNYIPSLNMNGNDSRFPFV